MSRTTFFFVLSKIDHRIRKEFVVEAPMNPDQSLALCLYRLAVLRLSLHNRRDGWTSRISCMPKVVEVCTTIIKELWLETVEIHFPKTNDEFKEKLLDNGNFLLNGNFRVLLLQLTEVICLLNVPV